MKDFKKLLIWQKGMEIVDKAYDLAHEFPKEELYGLRSQLTRSAVGIPANIAEGSAKSSQGDYARYLEISLGSSFELETLTEVARRRNWGSKKQVEELLECIVEEQRMLQSFIKKVS